MAQKIILDIQMLIGQETLMIESQPQGTCSRLAELLSAGEVKSKPLWLCQWQRRNTWPWQMHTRSYLDATTNHRPKESPHGAMMIFEDNQSAICMAKSPQFHGRTKYIEIKYHFIREQIKNGTVELKYCPTENIIADMLIKGLHKERFVKLRQMAGIKAMNEQSVRK